MNSSGLVATPTGRNRDSIFLVDGMPELAGIEAFGLENRCPLSSGEFIHFAPLDPTFNHLPMARSIKIFQAYLRPARLNRKLLGS